MPKGVLVTKYHFSDRTNIQGNIIALGISVSETHNVQEGEHLAAAVDAINQTECSLCLIVIGDSLQYPTMAIGKSAEQRTAIYDESLRLGKSWKKRNRPIYSQLKVPYKIIHWNALLGHPDYAEYRREADALYNSNTEFQRAVNDSVIEFSKRFKSRLSPEDASRISDEEIEKGSTEYLLQEGVVLTRVLAQKQVLAIFYPGKMLDAVNAARDRFVQETTPLLVQWVNYTFNRRTIKPSTGKELTSLVAYKYIEVDRLEAPRTRSSYSDGNPFTHFQPPPSLLETAGLSSLGVTRNPQNGTTGGSNFSIMRTGEVMFSIQRYFLLLQSQVLAAGNGSPHVNWQDLLSAMQAELQRYEEELQSLSDDSSSDDDAQPADTTKSFG